jgi:hypothetical protein
VVARPGAIATPARTKSRRNKSLSCDIIIIINIIVATELEAAEACRSSTD